MRFHVISLPHTQTTSAYPSCAFTQKVIRFTKMMTDLGHEVFLYSGDENEAVCTEHVSCISERRRAEMVGDSHYTAADWGHPYWQGFLANVVGQMHERIQPHDFICLIGGHAQKPIADAFPDHLSVEFGIGYAGTFARFRVFESYAWMHMIYGAQTGGNAGAADGHWFDAVIPNQVEDGLYPAGEGDGGYALYMGRLIDRKGYRIAQEVCEAKGVRLILAGPGEADGYGEFVGEVDATRRAELMAGARCLMVPTQYVEPFGTVHIEAMACGTPVVTSDFGVFTETVKNGINGFRCRSFAEFCNALDNVGSLDRKAIRDDAMARFSMGVVGKQYDDYFHRLATLWDKGWYQAAA